MLYRSWWMVLVTGKVTDTIMQKINLKNSRLRCIRNIYVRLMFKTLKKISEISRMSANSILYMRKKIYRSFQSGSSEGQNAYFFFLYFTVLLNLVRCSISVAVILLVNNNSMANWPTYNQTNQRFIQEIRNWLF